jgi:single-stranded DNA-binding protein
MSFHALVSGVLVADPQRREGSKAPFATAALRVQDGDISVLASVIGFGGDAEQLLDFTKGDAVALSGRAKLSNWVGRDGSEHQGLSVIVDQFIAAKPRCRAASSETGRVADLPARRSPPQRQTPPACSTGP